MMKRLRKKILDTLTSWLPDWAVHLLGFLGKTYTRHCPFSAGKQTIVDCKKLFRILELRRFEANVSSQHGLRYRVRFPDQIQRFLYFFGIWEPVLTRFVEESLGDGDTFVDVGANIGYYSILGSSLVGSKGRVFAIEALPSTFDELNNNLLLNNCSNVHATNCLVLDARSEEELFVGREQNLGCTGLFQNKFSPVSAGKLDAFPLTEIVEPETLYNARLVKIDVEGVEWRVIKGLEKQLELFSERTEWLIEVDPQRMEELGGSWSEFRAMFHRAGFRDFILENPFGVEWYAKNCYSFGGANRAELIRPGSEQLAEHSDVLFSKLF